MTLSKGIGAMKEKQKEVKKSMSGGGGNYIYIKDTESYLFRFMLDGDDVVSGYFHRIPVTRGEKSWYQETPCEGDGCPYCMSDEEDVARRSYRFLVWIWVAYIDHAEPDDDEKWEPVEKDDETYYREVVNVPKILKSGYYFSKLITALYGKYGTLLDRPFECIRSGEGLDTTYSVFPEDKRVMPKKIKDAVKKLKSLEDIVSGTDDEEEKEEEEEETSKSSKSSKAKGRGKSRQPVAEEEDSMDDPFE